MQHEWMIDVLSDLRVYAENHEMARLVEHLEDSILIAAASMQRMQDRKTVLGADEPKTRGIIRTLNAS